MIGAEILNLAKKLYPINRSLTGNGVRETLNILKEINQQLKIFEIPSGTQVFDWTIPNEWNVKDAYVLDPSGKKIIDFKKHNLHLVNYSIPVNGKFSLEELSNHLYSLPDQPDAIPYITSYYSPRWGFCLTQTQRNSLQPGEYTVLVDSEIKAGFLNYGEILIPGESEEEIFLSTYICHPSMCNNELSGPTVTIFLANWLISLSKRKYSYRIVFVPETIGSIAYLSKNLDQMKKRIIAGFNITCVGDNRAYSYLPSRNGETISDLMAQHVLNWTDANYKKYTWLDRGSDERQYCAPGIDLPVASIMRTKYAEYPEYHTSLDDFSVVTEKGLLGGFTAIKEAILGIEKNCYPKACVLGEPQLGKRGLYTTIGTKNSREQVILLLNFLSFSDGKHSLLDIAQKCSVAIWTLYPLLETLLEHQLITISDKKLDTSF